MLLSRVAENLYWAGRYLERAEDTARIVREHTNLIVDLPDCGPPSPGSRCWPSSATAVDFDARYRARRRASILRTSSAIPSTRAACSAAIEQARENLRTTREVLPREAWAAVNDLYLYVASNHTDGVARRSRSRFLERVIGECQRVAGILDGHHAPRRGVGLLAARRCRSSGPT